MARFFIFKEKEIGNAPDSLIYNGEKRVEEVSSYLFTYDKTELLEINSPIIQATDFASDKVNWLNINGLHQEEIFNTISEKYQIDKVVLSDILDTNQRPTIHELDDLIFISLKMFRVDEELKKIRAENFVIILKKDFLLSFQEIPGDVFNPIRDRIRKGKKIIRSSGNDFLGLSMLEVIFDNYSIIINEIGEKIEQLELQILSSTTKSVPRDINFYKTELSYLKKAIKPCRGILSSLTKSESEILSKRNKFYLTSLKDDLEHVLETIDSYNEILTNFLNIYHTNVSTKLNDIMKFLTIFSSVFIPITFIAGIYGTNFDNVPELHYKYGYFVMLGSMVVIAIGMLLFFRIKKWL